MNQDAAGLVDAFYTALKLGDVQTAMAFVHDDIEVGQVATHRELPFGQRLHGRQAALMALERNLKMWRMSRLEVSRLNSDGGTVRAVCQLSVEHPASGLSDRWTFKHTFLIRDGRIARFETCYDQPRLLSFLRYASCADRVEVPGVS